MSSLVSFNILSKKANILDVEVQIVHPDEHHINDSPNFALQIILELYENMQLGYIYNAKWSSYPFDKEKAIQLLHPDYKKEMDELLEKMRWKKIPITEDEYNQLEKEGVFEYNGQKLSSRGMENGQYYVSLETEYDEFCKEADKHIEKVEVLQVKNFPHWFDRVETWLEYGVISWGFEDNVYDKHQNEPNPTYFLRITINPESTFLLHHVQEKCYWESAAYNFLYYTKNFIETKKPVYHTLAYDSDIIPPTDDILENWWTGLSENWKKVIQANYYIQKNNIFPSIKHNFDGMITFNQFQHIYSKDLLGQLLETPLSLEDLRNISKMKMLYAGGFGLTDLTPIHILKGLKVLELEANPLQNVDVIGELLNLEKLTLIIYESNKPKQNLHNLTKMRDLSFDPSSQEELEAIIKMPNLRTFYTLLTFELDASIFDGLNNLKKIVGCSPSIKEGSQEILENLRKKGVEVHWDIEEM
ncbi:MAG: hypothetical protein MUC49_09055 [Raineya sp.]|jgi:hypothetical protein|nr:hypothetical protein [Raineya sp.]